MFLDALACQPTPRPPIWMMRQSGRYMPEYRAIREKYHFLDMIQVPELACEITHQPIDAYGMDAAILFSDILVTASAMGSDLDYIEGKGPVISNPVRSVADVRQLWTQDIPARLHYVTDAIKLLKNSLDIPLIGFAGAPFTVASYMVEGGSSSTLKTVKSWRYNDPEGVKLLLDALTDVTIDYMLAQVEAGVDALQLFDTWANHLAWDDFSEFSMVYMDRIIQAIRAKSDVPIIVFCKNSSLLYPQIANSKPDAISFDWNGQLGDIRQQLDKSIAMQGNLDPFGLYGTDKMIVSQTTKLLEAMAGHPGYIFNLGHGILPDMKPEKIKLVVDTVHAFKQTAHSAV